MSPSFRLIRLARPAATAAFSCPKAGARCDLADAVDPVPHDDGDWESIAGVRDSERPLSGPMILPGKNFSCKDDFAEKLHARRSDAVKRTLDGGCGSASIEDGLRKAKQLAPKRE